MPKSDFKILAIDDEKDILLLLKYNLESEGYIVKTASSGKEGLDIASEYNPDLILIDIMMPEIDGIETCRKLREIEKFQSTFILFLTARVEEYSEVAAFDAGGDDYITKPKELGPLTVTSSFEELIPFIDWTPFFMTWELAGKYPRILTDEIVGNQASDLFKDAQKMLGIIL